MIAAAGAPPFAPEPLPKSAPRKPQGGAGLTRVMSRESLRQQQSGSEEGKGGEETTRSTSPAAEVANEKNNGENKNKAAEGGNEEIKVCKEALSERNKKKYATTYVCEKCGIYEGTYEDVERHENEDCKYIKMIKKKKRPPRRRGVETCCFGLCKFGVDEALARRKGRRMEQASGW